MSDFFKKIRSIDTADDDTDFTKPDRVNKGDETPDTVSDDATRDNLGLRPASTSDEVKEVFSSENETDDEVLDSHLTDMALPGFLTRGLMENGKEPLKTPVVKSVKIADTRRDTSYIAPKDTRLIEQTSVPRSLSKDELKTNSQDDRDGFAYSKLLIFIAIFFWIVIASAIVYGFFELGLSWRTITPISLAGLTLFILGPAVLIGLTAYSFSQLARISRAAGRLDKTAQALMQPDDTVAEKTASLSAIIKNQIDTVDARLGQAKDRMADMEGIIRVQSDALDAMRVSIETSAHHITHTFQTERSEFESVSTNLDEKMQTFVTMVSDHSNNLARISKLAGQQITEARISTEGTAAKMNSASELVRQNTLDATASLKSGHEEIEHLGEMILQRAQQLDNVYTNHAKELTMMIEQLRDEQENLGVSLEARLAKMRDVSVSAKESAESLTIASDSGRKTVIAMAEAANITEDALRTRFSEMEKMVEYSNSRAENISQMAARRVQNSLALTRKEIARIETDMQALQDKMDAQLDITSLKTPKLHPSPSFGIAPEEAETLPPTTNAQTQKKKPIQDSISIDGDTSPIPETLIPQAKSTSMAKPKRRGLLRFRPVEDPIPNLVDETEYTENHVTEIPNPYAPPLGSNDPIDLNTDTELDLDSDIDSLDDSLAIPDSFKEDALTHHRNTQAEPSHYSSPMEAQAMPQVSDFKDVPKGHEDITGEHMRPSDDVIERITRSDHSVNSDKPKWSFRNIFKSSDPILAPAAPVNPNSTPESIEKPVLTPQPQLSRSNQEQIIATLTGMGLSPGAIVDDGCIIEAANTRRSNGASAMSHTVSNRIKEPVIHLRGALELNPELKSDARAFTSQFQVRLKAVENDREGIRTRLESESGRAFLLCDAALNG